MKCRDLTAQSERRERLAPCALSFALTFILFGARIFGGYAPFALGLIAAAGPGGRGLSALLGGVAGAVLLLDFSHALRALAAAVLLYTANNAFCETGWYRSRVFLPAMTASMCLSVELVYLLQSGIGEAATGLLSIALTVLTAQCARIAEEEKRADSARRSGALLVLTIGLLTALAAWELADGFAPGRILAMLLVLLLAYDKSAASALTAALSIGLAMDLAARTGSFLHTAVYGFGALAVGRERRARRVGAALWWCAPLLLLSLPLEAEEGLCLLYEGLCAALIFLLLPNRLFGGKRLAAEQGEAEAAQEKDGAERSAARKRLHDASQAMRELYDSLMRTPPAEEENPAMIFDRAAERVCRGCSLRTICWERDYAKTYNALNDATAALLAEGRGRGGDFPSYFTDRCIRFPSFLAAVNAELNAFLLRRQYRRRLADAHARAAGQYAELSELLSGTAEAMEAVPASSELLAYRVGAAMRAKEGERVSGDSVTHFETEDARLCLLLSDGMGCGEDARRESALAVRLLERFLRAGIEPAGALKTLNGALTLRAELSESFTTVDLVRLSLVSGEAEVYKFGAAPSYVKRGSRVRRITCSCLPAGLQSAGSEPDATRFTLARRSFLILLSDGVADVNDDGWLFTLLEGWHGDDPQQLASEILAAGREHRGESDDAAVLVLYLCGEGGTEEV